MKRLDALRQHSGVRYLLAGGSVYVIELTAIFVLQQMGVEALRAVAISFWIGLIASFVIQKFITFKDTRSKHSVLLSQVIAVGILVLFNFGFTILFTHLTTGVMPLIVSRTVALGVTTIWNYYLYKNYIFKRSSLLVD